MDIVIRKAEVKDARGIVEVYTYTWLTTYKGLIPDEILENRLNTIEERIPLIQKTIEEKNNMFVAVVDNKVVGVMSYGKSRNDDYSSSGEIYSIYVLEEYQGLGLGKKLFMTGIKELISKGYDTMILYVLSGNNTIKFYEKYCGVKIGQKQDKFGSVMLTEDMMYFENLKDLYSKFNMDASDFLEKVNKV